MACREPLVLAKAIGVKSKGAYATCSLGVGSHEEGIYTTVLVTRIRRPKLRARNCATAVFPSSKPLFSGRWGVEIARSQQPTSERPCTAAHGICTVQAPFSTA